MGREGPGHHAGDEHAEVDGGHRNGNGRRDEPSIDRRLWPEILDDPQAKASGRGIAIPFDPLAVAMSPGSDGPKELYENGIRHQIFPLSVINLPWVSVRRADDQS